jgi:hypothetical protein
MDGIGRKPRINPMKVPHPWTKGKCGWQFRPESSLHGQKRRECGKAINPEAQIMQHVQFCRIPKAIAFLAARPPL